MDRYSLFLTECERHDREEITTEELRSVAFFLFDGVELMKVNEAIDLLEVGLEACNVYVEGHNATQSESLA